MDWMWDIKEREKSEMVLEFGAEQTKVCSYYLMSWQEILFVLAVGHGLLKFRVVF